MQAEEVLYWSRFNNAVSNFCFSQVCCTPSAETVICSLVGEDLEWCGAHSFLFLVNRLRESQKKIQDLESRCSSAESTSKYDKDTISQLKKQMKENQRESEDSEWQLQEQVAQSKILITQEKEKNEQILAKLAVYKNKLIEVESFLNSDSGKLTLKFEEDLAVSKLRIAELEAEKDRLELELSKKNRLIGRGLGENASKSQTQNFSI